MLYETILFYQNYLSEQGYFHRFQILLRKKQQALARTNSIT